MKKLIPSVTFLMFLLMLPGRTLYAQSEGTSFKVRFSFVIAEQQMPAGQYLVSSLYWNAVGIHQLGGKASLITLAKPTQFPSAGEAKLIFRKYANRYFLVEARLPNMDTGRKFYTTKEEIEFSKKLPSPENVEVAAQ
jgi:hypothetical protein